MHNVEAATGLDGPGLVAIDLLIIHYPVAVLAYLFADVGSRAFPQS